MKITELYNMVRVGQDSCSQGIYALTVSKNIYLSSIDGSPALFIEESDVFKISESFSLKYIDVYTYQNCYLLITENAIKADFIVMKINSDDPILIEWFLVLIEGFVQSIMPVNVNYEFCHLIEKFVSIFSKIDAPPKGTIIGLIGELLLINSSIDTDFMIESWHTDPMSRIDFVNKKCRIEVKTTTRQQRIHRIKLNQLCPFNGIVVYYASLIIELVGDGMSLFELINLIVSKCKKVSSKEKISSIVSETLGKAIRGIKDVQFDFDSASYSLCLYLNEDIPRPLIADIPTSVSSISFDVDFSSIRQIEHEQRVFVLS